MEPYLIMIEEKVGPASEIDAYCTKCRLVTNHRVVAMVEGAVKRVVCLTCNGQHNFRAAPGQKAPKASSRVRRMGQAAGGPSRAATLKALDNWLERRVRLGDAEVPAYDMAASYKEGQALMHPKFGLGFVSRVLGRNKIDVVFERELKTLAMNYGG